MSPTEKTVFELLEEIRMAAFELELLVLTLSAPIHPTPSVATSVEATQQ